MYLYPMHTVLITGGTGMVGTSLTHFLLNNDYRVIILTRRLKQSTHPNLTYAIWDIAKGYIDPLAIQQADTIVHLAGEGVADKRWTAQRKKEILESRVLSGKLLATTLTKTTHHVKTVIAASAIGWYGPDTKQSLMNGFNEQDGVDHSFLGDTCQQWEQSLESIQSTDIRYVTLRLGIILNMKGGAFLEFIKPARFGMATILGDGKQIVSWIHEADVSKMIHFCIEQSFIKGVYNAVAPSPITNQELVIAITKKMRGFYIPIPVPALMLKIMLGEMSIEVLKSANVSCAKIQAAGFEFAYPSIDEALNQLLK